MCAYRGKLIVDTVRELLAKRTDLREVVRVELRRGRELLLPTQIGAAHEVLCRSGDEEGLELLREMCRAVQKELDAEEMLTR
jgi:hypothetical protein